MKIYIYLAIIVYVIVEKVATQENCPWGWRTSRTDTTWPCYLLTNKIKRSWREAQNFCTVGGGSLLKIESQAEMNWVFKIFKAYQGFFPTHQEWWIGLRDNPAGKGLMWIDRSVPNVGMLPWSPGEPTNYDHNNMCIEYNNGTLRHQDCSTPQYFACKRSRESPIWCDAINGWESFSGKCYRVTHKLLSYDDARGECQRQNGDLIFVDSQSTETFLNIFVESRRANMWIGLRYYNGTGGFSAHWNGPAGSYVKAQAHFWAISDPDIAVIKSGGEASCVYGSYGVPTPNIWNVANCSQKMFSVCQKDQGSCSAGWFRNERSCYTLNRGPKLSWNDAKTYCKQRGAELLYIPSQSTQNFINSNLQNFHSQGIGSIWMGLSDGSSSGNYWAWTSGVPSTRGYTNFNGYTPVNRPGVMDCFNIFTDDKNGTWQVAANCSAKKRFLCDIGLNQAPKLPTTATPTTHTLPATGTTSATVWGNWSTDCGPFWIKDKLTGYCYQISDHEITWAKARSTCQSMGADLASITSYHEESFIADRLFGLATPALWIGMNNLNSQDGYEWTDGSGFGYMNWAPGEPNNRGSNEHCAEFIGFQEKLGLWNDVNCNAERGYICKKKSSDFPTTPQPTMPSIPASKTYGCPNNLWQGYGSSCFLFINNSSSWKAANVFCQIHNFNLASLANENEQNFVFSQLPVVTGYRDQFWIGLTDSQQQMNFKWTDKSAVSFTNWARGEPNNYQNRPEDCVTIYQKTGHWNDELCESPQAGFVCKTPKSLLPRGTPQYNYGIGCTVPGSIGYGAKCYLKVTSIMTYNSANRVCSSKGGNLAVIHDKYQQAFLASQIASHTGYFGYFWIGLAHTLTGQLQWTNGDKVDFTAWSANHTGNDNTTCVSMRSNGPGVGLWVDFMCAQNLHYICEYPRPGYSTPNTPATTTSAPLKCPYKWHEYSDSCFNAYAGNTDRKTWLDARDFCQAMGADLPSFHSRAEENFAFSYQVIGSGHFTWLYHADSFWTGLNDFDREKAYKWSDGSAVSYTNWGRGEPNDASGNDDCVEYNKYSSNWNDNNCYVAKPFVCKIKKGVSLKAAVTTPTPLNPCASTPGWKSYNGSCYYISPKYGTYSRLSWFNAQQYCLKNGGHLASAHSEQENNFFVTLISTTIRRNVWIGLTDLGVNQFRWSDGTPVDYTKWNGNEPNDAFGSEKCAQIKSDTGYWNDNDCGELYNFICKKPTTGATPGTLPTTPLVSGGCPRGFTGVYNGNKCYKIVGSRSVRDRLNYTSARDACRKLVNHSDIASFSNHQELASVIVMVNGLFQDHSGVWTGLNDLNNNRRFTWQDGSRVDLINWAKGQPQGSSKCVEMLTDSRRAGTWNAIPCSSTRPYICEAFRDSNIPKTTQVSGCRDGYIANVLDCYKIQKTPMTWNQSKQACENDQASLTSIMSVFEQAFIDTITSTLTTPVWIGLGDSRLTGTFTWTDTYPVTFTQWGKNEPTHTHGESCVSTQNGFWNDTMCSQTFPSICKISFFAHTSPATVPVGYCRDMSWKEMGNFCYLIVLDRRETKSYPDAAANCASRGMQLTSVMSKAEENFILKEIDRDTNPNANVWIGLRRSGGFFSWSDGSSTDYINWQNTGPTGKNCVYMKHIDGTWADDDCTVQRGYVCKSRKLPPTSPPPTTTTISTSTQTTISTTLQPSPSSTSSSKASTTLTSGSGSANVASTSPYNVPLPQNSRQIKHKDTLSGGGIAGIIIGVLALLGIVAVVLMVVKKRAGGQMFAFKSLRNGEGFENAAYDRSMDSVKINNSNGKKSNGQINGKSISVGFQDFDHSDS